VDLDVCYTDIVAMSRLFQFLTGGRLDPSSDLFLVSPSQLVDKSIHSRNDPEPLVTVSYSCCRSVV